MYYWPPNTLVMGFELQLATLGTLQGVKPRLLACPCVTFLNNGRQVPQSSCQMGHLNWTVKGLEIAARYQFEVWPWHSWFSPSRLEWIPCLCGCHSCMHSAWYPNSTSFILFTRCIVYVHDQISSLKWCPRQNKSLMQWKLQQNPIPLHPSCLRVQIQHLSLESNQFIFLITVNYLAWKGLWSSLQNPSETASYQHMRKVSPLHPIQNFNRASHPYPWYTPTDNSSGVPRGGQNFS